MLVITISPGKIKCNLIEKAVWIQL